MFVAVAEQLSFTRAAEGLHLTQQFVSENLRDLERELGVTLLERTTREVRMTPAGAALLVDGRQALRQADAAFARAREIGTGRCGALRIGHTPAVGPTDREEVARVLRRSEPGLSVVLVGVRPKTADARLRDHEIDLVLVRTHRVQDPAIHQAQLRRTPMDVHVPRGHRLARRASVTTTELDGETLLVASPPGTPCAKPWDGRPTTHAPPALTRRPPGRGAMWTRPSDRRRTHVAAGGAEVTPSLGYGATRIFTCSPARCEA